MNGAVGRGGMSLVSTWRGHWDDERKGAYLFASMFSLERIVA